MEPLTSLTCWTCAISKLLLGGRCTIIEEKGQRSHSLVYVDTNGKCWNSFSLLLKWSWFLKFVLLLGNSAFAAETDLKIQKWVNVIKRRSLNEVFNFKYVCLDCDSLFVSYKTTPIPRGYYPLWQCNPYCSTSKKVSVSVPPVAGVSRQSTLKNHYRTIKPENSFLIDPYNPFLLLEVPS